MKATVEWVDKIQEKKETTYADLEVGDWFTWWPDSDPVMRMTDGYVYANGLCHYNSGRSPQQVTPIKVHLQCERL